MKSLIAAAVLFVALLANAAAQTEHVLQSGSDIPATAGEALQAPAAGVVSSVHPSGDVEGYRGQVVDIDHGDGVKTRYSNLADVALAPGARVQAGDLIGRVAGDHVHIELWRASVRAAAAH